MKKSLVLSGIMGLSAFVLMIFSAWFASYDMNGLNRASCSDNPYIPKATHYTYAEDGSLILDPTNAYAGYRIGTSAEKDKYCGGLYPSSVIAPLILLLAIALLAFAIMLVCVSIYTILVKQKTGQQPTAQESQKSGNIV